MLKLCLVALLAVAVAASDATVNNVGKSFSFLNKPAPHTTLKTKAKTFWIQQKLDHFDHKETRTWPMRYLGNSEFYKPGGPLFISVGGEEETSSDLITSGHVYDMARQHSGYLFQTEHRYYGESRPVRAMTNDNMKYLTAQQALADLAHFIRTVKSSTPSMKNSKVILIGCSYSGALVTWFKKLYPDLAVGGWASSAPLKTIVDFSDYKVSLGHLIRQIGGDACHNRIKHGFAKLESLVDNKQANEVRSQLNLCKSFNVENNLDVSVLFVSVNRLFANLVQNHKTNEIQNACRKIMQGANDLVGLTNYLRSKLDTTECNDLSYRSYLEDFTDQLFEEDGARPWTYQTCNELGWFDTTGSRYQPFGTKCPLSFFTTLCADAFGSKFTKQYIQQRVDQTNQKYGGLTPRVSNVYWTHGQWDPWISLGIHDQREATIIPHLTHCKDMDSLSNNDSAELKAAKKKIAELVRTWLA